MTATQAEIRAWAQANDVPCSRKGNIPAATRAAYDAAHGKGSPPPAPTTASPTSDQAEQPFDPRVGDTWQITYLAQLTTELQAQITTASVVYRDDDGQLCVAAVRLYDEDGAVNVDNPQLIERGPLHEAGADVWVKAHVRSSSREATGEITYLVEVLAADGAELATFDIDEALLLEDTITFQIRSGVEE